MGSLALLITPAEPDPREPDPVAHLVEEARAIAAGQSSAEPQVEHIQALLVWLDGISQPQQFEELPF